MKTHLTALTLFTMMTPFSEAADVTVNFAGVNTLSGQLYLAVYASEEDMKSRKAIQSQIITVHNADQKAVLADLPSGHYGVMGPPSFSDIQFDVATTPIHLTINME